jgi:predicted nucleic acid-binding protein
MDSYVAIDSNCFTYLVEAMYASQKPTDNLANQKISLLRLHFYRKDILYISATVLNEYERITDKQKKEKHHQTSAVQLGEVSESDPKNIEKRFEYYRNSHSGEKEKKDCRILAESELGGCQYLLTYDQRFLNHLKSKTKTIKMITPFEYWNLLNVIKGVNPERIPTNSNPLSKQEWWRW